VPVLFGDAEIDDVQGLQVGLVIEEEVFRFQVPAIVFKGSMLLINYLCTMLNF
jgi:hypothetical protein